MPNIVEFPADAYPRRIMSQDRFYLTFATQVQRLTTDELYILDGTWDGSESLFYIKLDAGPDDVPLSVKVRYGDKTAPDDAAGGNYTTSQTYDLNDWLAIVMEATRTTLKVWVNNVLVIDATFSQSAEKWWSPWAMNSQRDTPILSGTSFRTTGVWFFGDNVAINAATYATFFTEAHVWVSETATINGETAYFSEFRDAAGWNSLPDSGFRSLVGEVVDFDPGLIVQDLGIALSTENISLTGEGNLTVQDMAIAIATDNVQLSAESDLVVQGMALAVGTENVTLGGGGDLTVQHLGISVSAENLDLTGEGNLVVQDLGIALATENIALTAAVLLDVQDLGIGVHTDNLELTGSGFLVVQDLGIAVGSENVNLAGAADLIVQDLAIGLAAENITLTAEGALTVQDVAIATAVENIALTAAGSLEVDPLGIGMVVDVVTLAAQSDLSVQDLGIALELENIDLYEGFIAIPVNPTVSIVPIKKTVSIVPIRRTVKLEN